MGFYLRKAIRVGPFRVNISKSGLGVSAGIPGFRVGTGPRGNYVHMGRGGLYYRKTLGTMSPWSDERARHLAQNAFQTPGIDTEPIDSTVCDMADSSSQVLLDEINEKRQRAERARAVCPNRCGVPDRALYRPAVLDAPCHSCSRCRALVRRPLLGRVEENCSSDV